MDEIGKVTAGLPNARAQLHVNHGADEGDKGAQNPHANGEAEGAGALQDGRGRNEDTSKR